MGRYIDWEDVVARYPSINNVGGAAEVGSVWIGPVEFQLEAMLSPQYSAPFSSNNETVKDLLIELTYIRVGNLKVEEAESYRKMFMERIERIKMGTEGMVTTSGDLVGSVGETIWSSTENYNSVFDVDPAIEWEVDSSQVYNIENDKS